MMTDLSLFVASLSHTFAHARAAFATQVAFPCYVLRKQELDTLSTAEAECVAETHAAKECIWLHCLIGDLSASVMASVTVPTLH
jgi:hypothetical protein